MLLSCRLPAGEQTTPTGVYNTGDVMLDCTHNNGKEPTMTSPHHNDLDPSQQAELDTLYRDSDAGLINLTPDQIETMAAAVGYTTIATDAYAYLNHPS